MSTTDEPFASFLVEWNSYRAKIGPKHKGAVKAQVDDLEGLRSLFPPDSAVALASKVSDHFLSQFGGIWTGRPQPQCEVYH